MNITIEELDERIQIEALKLGYLQPTNLKPIPVFEQILKENKKRPTIINAQKYLNKNRKLIDNKTFLYWSKIAKKLKK